MAMAVLARTLITRRPTFSSPTLSRSFSSIVSRSSSSSTSALCRFRPLVSLSEFRSLPCLNFGLRCFSTRPTTSSLNDPSPNWNNRPPKETILLDGCDFEHWLIVLEKPEGDPTRDDIIDSYIKTLATVVGSEEEARHKIYSVSTRHYFAFGCIVSEEVSYKIKELPRVRWVLPDSYLDVKNKNYGGEPFINGEAVPYDPKYHEEWVRNNARANERSRRNDRPRNFDRSRNFERRRENMQNRDAEISPMPNRGAPNTAGGPPGGNFQSGPPGGNFQNGPPAGNFQGGSPSGNFQSGPPGGNFQSGPPVGNFQGGPPGGNFQNGPPAGNFQNGPPAGNFQGGPPGGNFQNGSPSGNFQNGPPSGNFQNRPPAGNFQGGPPGGNFQSGPPGGNFQSGPSGADFQNGPPSGNFQTGSPRGNFQSPQPNRGNVPHNYSAQYPNAPNPGHAQNVPYNTPSVPNNAGYQNSYTPNGRDIPVRDEH